METFRINCLFEGVQTAWEITADNYRNALPWIGYNLGVVRDDPRYITITITPVAHFVRLAELNLLNLSTLN